MGRVASGRGGDAWRSLLGRGISAAGATVRRRSRLLLGIHRPQESSALITEALRDALAPRRLSCSVMLYSVLTCLANSASRSGPEGRCRLHYCLHICVVENQQLKPTPHCPRLGVPIRQGSVPLNRLPAHPRGTGLMRKESYPPWRRKERTPRAPALRPSPLTVSPPGVPGPWTPTVCSKGSPKNLIPAKVFSIEPPILRILGEVEDSVLIKTLLRLLGGSVG